jgi:pSer/pThr/pTyr-binding forkhead associated (FHA) protein
MLRKLGDRILARDLGSKNGTFVNGNQIRAGTEVEIKEGVSIVIGMSVISLGEGGSDQVLALVDSIIPSQEHRAPETLLPQKTIHPEKHKPNNLGSNLTLGTWRSSNSQFSKSTRPA